jgi:uncharacterized protein YrzB (UPF0473 family)
VQATKEDISDDLKALIDIGMYTEEEVLSKYASNNFERRYVLTKPILRKEGDGESAKVVAQVFKERYTEDELDVNAITVNTVDTDSLAGAMNSDDDDEWLKEMFG